MEIQRDLPLVGRRVLLIGGSRLEDLGLILLTIEDVTQQRDAERALQKSEEQRRQSEKMETVGRLAGGIAHDFNNLLTVIIGDAELLRDARGNDQEVAELTQEICRTAEKAATLTEQLLTFSRRKVLQPRMFDLNPLIGDFESMLRRLLGEQIKILVRLAAESCLVDADPAEIGRVVMNLCVNARDAMPAGGVLSIETGHVTLDPGKAAQESVRPGRYVRLVIADTGLGMDAETRQRAFEPFFSTKDVSQGGGLGLATVFGIVQRSGGAVACDSELGQGTRFTILLPVATKGEAVAQPGSGGLGQAPKGSEVVLLVDDEDAVRGLTKRILRLSGYVVLEASNGREGLSAIEAHSGPLDLLISDVLMPEMTGPELAERALLLRPDLKVLLVSGHAEDAFVKQTTAQGLPFLQKPYAPAELARKVREVLDANRAPPPQQKSAIVAT
ncbi:MAG TPA: response regulator [Polyangiaceae bacterium]|nr:response regulator [Polyangiaceae bacterium]